MAGRTHRIALGIALAGVSYALIADTIGDMRHESELRTQTYNPNRTPPMRIMDEAYTCAEGIWDCTRIGLGLTGLSLATGLIYRRNQTSDSSA